MPDEYIRSGGCPCYFRIWQLICTARYECKADNSLRCNLQLVSAGELHFKGACDLPGKIAALDDDGWSMATHRGIAGKKVQSRIIPMGISEKVRIPQSYMLTKCHGFSLSATPARGHGNRS